MTPSQTKLMEQCRREAEDAIGLMGKSGSYYLDGSAIAPTEDGRVPDYARWAYLHHAKRARGLAVSAYAQALYDERSRTKVLTDEETAKAFHEAYERLAPEYNYNTREASAKPWEQVPDNNKALMIAAVRSLRDNGYLAPSAEPKAKTYSMSKDYDALYDLLCDGGEALGLMNHLDNGPHGPRVATDIRIMHNPLWRQLFESGITRFKSVCENQRLEWLAPSAGLTADEAIECAMDAEFHAHHHYEGDDDIWLDLLARLTALLQSKSK